MYSLCIDCTALQNLLSYPLNILLLHVQSPAFLYAVDVFTTSKSRGIVKVVFIHIVFCSHCEMGTRESFLWRKKKVPQNICAPACVGFLTNSVQGGKHFIKQVGKDKKLCLNRRSSDEIITSF